MLAVKWGNVSWAAPLGISFYSLQIAAYLTDIYRGRIAPLQNPLRYLLFVSFFKRDINHGAPPWTVILSNSTTAALLFQDI